MALVGVVVVAAVTAAVTGVAVPGEAAILGRGSVAAAGGSAGCIQICTSSSGQGTGRVPLIQTEAQTREVTHPTSPHKRQRQGVNPGRKGLDQVTIPRWRTVGRASCRAPSSRPWELVLGTDGAREERGVLPEGASSRDKGNRPRLWRVPGGTFGGVPSVRPCLPRRHI